MGVFLHAGGASGSRLDAHWEPVDILVSVHQIATAWAAQPDLLPPDDEGRARFLAKRRAAVISAVERLFPATTNVLSSPCRVPRSVLSRPGRRRACPAWCRTRRRPGHRGPVPGRGGPSRPGL
ncbi:hypothetical protein K4B79_35455 [Streptomyces lincolnensis]|uniref:hypothetical protein n=1 Tax=Streptomyces lincolnensis TaxID=1915 RepID=UPI0035ABEFB2|nr:hypothetical protein [Streptomyces lincolnensis]